ncbi:hypothetical protein [Streptomyces sp. NBC_01235]|uniref:hypothetical protein n=1 Tax=Streptomyces sp. NBC_01235 TaxID=2903788 RepID=UPI002E109081|nr:hypothetical protein OG289_17295 [Streptomyces sp. NBC_01235]
MRPAARTTPALPHPRTPRCGRNPGARPGVPQDIGRAPQRSRRRSGGTNGIPVRTKDTTARRINGSPGGAFDVTTGLLDRTAYGYARDSTMLVWDFELRRLGRLRA